MTNAQRSAESKIIWRMISHGDLLPSSERNLAERGQDWRTPI